MALAQMHSPRELDKLRRKAMGKLIVLGFGPGGNPLGIFSTIDGAIWSMRHYEPYQPERWWWVQFFDKDKLDDKGSYCHTIHDDIVRYVFGKRLV